MSPPEAGTETKICQFDVSIAINEDVVWLDVSVNETHLMNALYRTHQLSDVEPGEGEAGGGVEKIRG